MNWSRERQEALERYVQADRTDPFTFDRCKLHMSNGIAGMRPQVEPMPWVSEHDPRRMSVLRQDIEAFYGATQHTEMRTILVGGEEITFPVIEYRNRVRP